MTLANIRKLKRTISLSLIAVLILQTGSSNLFALTGGPSQPEFQQFQPAGMSDLVDPFTGDFKYNIPLFDVGGYPINLSYSSNISQEDEAGWVGLGWSLNPGNINRNLRGIPDDFKGDIVEEEMNIRDNTTVGTKASGKFEFFGFLGIGGGLGLFYNTYNGWGFEISASPSLIVAGNNDKNGKIGLNLDYNSQAGLALGLSLASRIEKEGKQNELSSLNINGYNTRTGLKTLNFSGSSPLWKDKSLPYNASLSFSSPTYFPQSEFSMRNSGYLLDIGLGGALWGVYGKFAFDGYVDIQTLATKHMTSPAYGLLYAKTFEKITQSVLQDYNKEKDIPYRNDMDCIGQVYSTPDIFYYNTQTGSGQFQSVRNDLGTFTPALCVSNGLNFNLGLEFGAASEFGGSGGVGFEYSYTDSWHSGNTLKEKLIFSEKKLTNQTPSDALYEPCYFSVVDELNKTRTGFTEKLGGYQPARIKLKEGFAFNANTIDAFQCQDGSGTITDVAIPGEIRNTDSRPARNTGILALNAKEASVIGFMPKIENYKENIFNVCSDSDIEEEIERTDRPHHHISEIQMTLQDGSRQVFGLPIYNNFQEEISFAVAPPVIDPEDPATDEVSYTTTENSLDNVSGIDHFYKKQKTPPHATGYLLTGIVSPDYYDVKGDGITEDDLGNAIKFNYFKSGTTNWRAPFNESRAKWNKGNLSDPDDDKASIVYGQRENWFLHSIESKKEVAHFYTSEREDDRNFSDVNGALSGTKPLRKLDSIKVYSISELKEKGTTNATPIKVIRFEYDYILCPLENETQPKLTLTDVYTTFERSKVRYSNYHFDYYEEYTENGSTKIFKHGPLKQDRWGAYRSNDYTHNEFLDWFPYTLQDKAVQDEYSKAFKISKITLPSGGYIDINYESDDYAYVQDKRAGQMMMIDGFSKDGGSPGDLLYTDKDNINNEIVVTFPEPCPEAEVSQRYFENVDQIFADFEVDLNGDGLHKERIRGYLDYDSTEVIPIVSDVTHLATGARIPIKLSLGENSLNYHPMTIIGGQLLRTSLQKYIYKGYSNSSPTEATIKGMEGFIDELSALFKSWEKIIVQRKYVQKVSLDRSWIRLANGNFKKLGGGSRVHTLVMHDNWDNMDSDQSAAEYTQEYTYTTKTKIGNQEIEISSGVAAWEPYIGREENLHIRQVAFKEKVILAPDNFFYTEKPYCEGLFPGPSVGYSEIKVRNVVNSVDNSSNGYNVMKFYTAKDFPTLVASTTKYPFYYKTPILGAMFFKKAHRAAASQGFKIETNDMHGKPKETTSYNEAGNEIESTRYDYYTQNTGDRVKLSNEVTLIDKDGSKSTGEIGVTMQTSQEFSESFHESRSINIQANMNLLYFAFFIVPFFTGFGGANTYHSSLKTASNTKHIHRTGILKSVTKRLNGASTITENVAFDGGTGRPVVTSVQNEFNDLHFNTSYPAYWVYERMGGAFSTVGAEGYVDIGAVDRQISASDPLLDIFTPGDELLIGYDDGGELKILDEIYSVLEMPVRPIIVDRLARYIPDDIGNTIYYKILRPGNRNQLNPDVYSVNYASTSPIGTGSTGLQGNIATNVLNAVASDFSEEWPISRIYNDSICAEDTIIPTRAIGLDCKACDTLSTNKLYNPYAYGMKGNYRTYRTWAFQSNRISAGTADLNTNLRTDGTISSFGHFWEFESSVGGYKLISNLVSSHWVRSDSISKYDAAGNAVESYDALNIPSAALYARNNQFVVGAAKNAHQQDIAVDGFEDWPQVTELASCTFNGCFLDPHFDFLSSGSVSNRSAEKAHTGKYSFKLTANNSYYENRLVETSNSFTEFYSVGTLSGKEGYFFHKDGLIPGFRPNTGKYIVSGWISETGNGSPGTIEVKTYSDDNCSVQTGTYSFTARGQVIDGWRRVFGTIDIPSGSHCIQIKMKSNGNTCYFDDIRVHPYDAQMQSFAYDYSLNRLMATLDENNYASFYEYDDSGQLVRVKRETDKGIRTIKEERSYMPRQQEQ